MTLRNYTAMRLRQLREPVELHDFAHQKGKGLPYICGCGRHVLNLTAHNRLTQAQLDAIAAGLYYPKGD